MGQAPDTGTSLPSLILCPLQPVVFLEHPKRRHGRGPGTLQVQGADSGTSYREDMRTFISPLLMLLLPLLMLLLVLLSGHRDPATMQRAPQNQAGHPELIRSSQQPQAGEMEQFTYN